MEAAQAQDDLCPAPRRPIVIRVSGIRTKDVSEAEKLVRTTIESRLTTSEKETIDPLIEIVPSCTAGSNLTALCDFDRLPAFLSETQGHQPTRYQARIQGSYRLSFDAKFIGFTQLYMTPSTPVFDIIFITGIGGHAYGSWTAKTEPWCMWPRDFLQQQFPDCRVLIYGYDLWLPGTSSGELIDYMRDFKGQLRLLRSSCPTRPIIFVAHSFGGNIVKSCLLKDKQSDNQELYPYVRGIVFFAVPHRGMDMEDMMTAIKHKGSMETVLEQTSQPKHWRQELDNFVDIVHGFTVASFYETRLTNRLEQDSMGRFARTGPYFQALRPENATLGLSDRSELKHPVNADHSEIVKFEDETTPAFQIVLNYLLSQIANSRTVFEPYQMNKDEECCLQAFRTTEYERYKNLNTDRAEDTCLWFLRHPTFQRWQKLETHNLLWVSGDPGCGKSVLAKFLIDEALETPDPASIVCYFFFKEDSEKQQSAANAVCAVLHKILSSHPALIKHAITEFRSNGKKLSGLFDQLWTIFLKVVADERIQSVICVFDGLDECNIAERNLLFEALERCFGDFDAPRNTKFRCIVTSRPYSEIETGFEGVAHIQLRGEDESEAIGKEINLVVNHRIDKLVRQRRRRGFTKELGDFLKRRLNQHRNWTYLWLHLVFEELEANLKNTKDTLRSIVNNLPLSVNAAYEKILSRTTDIEQTATLLSIIVAATEPLSVVAIQMAMEIIPKRTSLRNVELETIEGFKTRIRNACGLFISIKDDCVYLIHQTARQFLIATTSHRAEDKAIRIWKHSIDLCQANELLARRCIAYILLDEIKDSPLKLPEPVHSWIHSEIEHRKVMASYASMFPFLRYAAINWSYHLQESQQPGHIDFVYSKICNTLGYYFYTWFPFYWYARHNINYPKKLTTLHAACIIGSIDIARRALDDEMEIDAQDTALDLSALGWASMLGFQDIAIMLLDAKASINLKNSFGQSPITVAIEHGHFKMVELLASRGASIPARTGNQTPLILAVRKGYQSIVEFLVQKRVDLEARDYSGRNALLWATKNGNCNLIKILLQSGANLNVLDSTGRTLLELAIREGGEDASQIFLDKQPDTDTLSDRFIATLVSAIEKKYSKIIDGLFQEIKSLEGADSKGQTLLIKAAKEGHEGILEELLRRGVQLNAQDKDGRTACIWSVTTGHLSILKILLDHGADMEISDVEGSTALIWSIRSGYPKLMQLLLERGANARVRDDAGFSALAWASQKGKSGERFMRKALLEHGASLESEATIRSLHSRLNKPRAIASAVALRNLERSKPTDIDRTRLPSQMQSAGYFLPALRSAYRSGDYKSVFDIISAYLKVSDKTIRMTFNGNNNRGSILIAGMKQGVPTSDLQFLIDNGASTEERDAEGDTALIYATRYAKEIAIRFLLNNGANIEARDKDARTPLMIAASIDDDRTFEYLLYRNADVESRDCSGINAPMIAALSGSCNVVRELKRLFGDDWIGPQTAYKMLSRALALSEVETVRNLMTTGAAILARNIDGFTGLMLAAGHGSILLIRNLLDAGADVNESNLIGWTALMSAAEHGLWPEVALLLDRGADIEATTADGYTPLLVAAEARRPQAVNLLLNVGANIEASNIDGSTALILCASQGDDLLVEELLSRGANVEARNKLGSTSIMLAAKYHHESCMRALRSYGALCRPASCKF